MEISLSNFVLSVLVGSGLLVVLSALLSRTLHARSEARALANRVICRLCLHAFEDSQRTPIVHCPRCGAANEKGHSRRLG